MSHFFFLDCFTRSLTIASIIIFGTQEFKYSRVQHNVKEVTDATYRSCDASDGVFAVYVSGRDEIMLNESRKYNFICDEDSHCIGGMRFSITVLEDSRSSNNTSPTPAPPPPAPNSAVAAGRNAILNFGMAMGVSVLVYYYSF